MFQKIFSSLLCGKNRRYPRSLLAVWGIFALVTGGCSEYSWLTGLQQSRVRSVQLTPAEGEKVGRDGFVEIALTFSTVVQVQGKPRVAFLLGGVNKYADYHLLSASGRMVRFRYAVAPGDVGLIRVIAGTSIVLGADASITDPSDNPVILLLEAGSAGGSVELLVPPRSANNRGDAPQPRCPRP